MKLLIVDTTLKVRRRKKSIEGTEVTFVNTLDGLLELLKCHYTFDYRSWIKENPAHNQWAGMARMIESRRLELASRTPYWDGILFFLKHEDELLAAIGAANIASICGCRYIRIVVRVKESFRWLPLDMSQSRSQAYDYFDVGPVSVRKDRDRYTTDWQADLYFAILRREYDGKRSKEEVFKKAWPGFPWKDHEMNGFFC
jgi:hypothetical protein